MTTIKQELALGKLVENGGNVTQAMRDVGYSEATINNPSNLTHSKGYKEILYEYGLTENLVVRSLVSDIESKPERRLGELSLAADILGLRKTGLVVSNQVNLNQETKINTQDPRLVAIAMRFEEEYRNLLRSNV